MSQLWMSIEPEYPETRIMLTMGGAGTQMRARLPLLPSRPEALGMFLQAIGLWYGQSFCAVLDADCGEVSKHPERWARLLGDLDDAYVTVQWGSYGGTFQRDPLVGQLGDFRRARRLLTHSATGLK